VWEWDRRRHLPAAGEQVLRAGEAAVPAPQEIEQKYRDPDEFARFCAAARDRAVDMRERFLRLEHTHGTRVTEYDRRGEVSSELEYVDRMWFEGGQGQHEEMSRRQVKGSLTREQFERWTQSGGKVAQEHRQTVQPFSREEGTTAYDYRFEGVEEIGGRPVVKVRFEPQKGGQGRLRGLAWVDARTADPVRFHATVARPPALVDHYEILHEYGPSETGHVQARRGTVEIRGGLAFLSFHYRIEAELSEYRERPGK
jgi:hypothetical protein